ncbi:MAG: glycosyltransferase family 2 protein [Clostridia bacterium]|nr:glycosyltransferase family 2 protein [Clostridia bacterium]
MKLLTCVVPCYNSAAYMHKAVDTLLTGGEEMDILIVDDGSMDDTGRIADEYAAAHPGVVRVIHQANAGHGAGLNQGIRTAEGLYFKVVDSDDRVDPEALKKLLDVLRSHSRREDQVDLVVHDYVYDRGEMENVFSVSFSRVMRGGQVKTWSDCRHFPATKQFMIHCIVYRVQLLRDHRYELPEHVFFEDNLYIYQPLPWTKTLAYCPAAVYGYNIGREGQSVSEENILRRLDQLGRMITRMATSYHLSEIEALPKPLGDYMISNVAAQVLCLNSLQFIQDTPASLAAYEKFWADVKAFDEALYHRLWTCPAGFATHLPGKIGRRLLVGGYRLAHRVMKF